MLGTVWKRWNWLEDGLIPLAATLMYAAWAYPLFALFVQDFSTGTKNPGFTFWLCLGILLGGAVAGRLASQNRMGAVIVVVGGLAAVLVSLLLTVPAGGADLPAWVAGILDRVEQGREGEVVPVPMLVAICAALLWWRGVRVATAEHNETTGSFVVGVTALGGLLVLAAVLPSAPSVAAQRSRSLTGTMAPLAFLLSIPLAAGFALLSRFLGGWAFTASQLALVIGLLLLATVLPSGPPPEALIGWILLFLASGLATLSLASVLRALREQERRIGVRLRVDRYWLMTMLSVVVSVLLVGLLAGQVLAPATFIRALSWIRPIWDFVLRILLLIIFVFAYLFFSLLEPLLAAMEGRPRQANPRPWMSPLEPQALEEVAREPIKIPPIFGQIMQAVLILGAIGLVGWIFFLAVQRQGKGAALAPDDVLETRETILSVDLLRSQIQGLFDGFRRARPTPLFLEPGPPGDPRRIVRELYQKVLAQAIELKLPRKKGQTPSAYQHTLLYLCREEQSSLETLTRAYVIARYGVSPPTREQVQAAQEAFGRIDAAFQTKARSTSV